MRIKDFINNTGNKAAACAAAAGAGIKTYLAPVYAADISVSSITIKDSDPNTILAKVLGIIVLVARFIGSALLLWGLVMFALAIKNDEPESKQKALMTVFAGVILIALKSILTAAGIIG